MIRLLRDLVAMAVCTCGHTLGWHVWGSGYGSCRNCPCPMFNEKR